MQEHVDHRKRRRNRTTQSCLNCHGSKRMCDRKRPACSRCVKLGLSGTCVYEVDDVSQRSADKDEVAHLKNRIAELEGFIREFKRKPHPRWSNDLRNRHQSIPSSPQSENGMDSDTSDIQNPPGLDNSDSCASLNSPSSDNVPHTPSGTRACPTFFGGQQDATLSEFPEATKVQTPYIEQSSIAEFSTSHADFDHIFGFDDCSLLPREDDSTLARVFSQVLQAEMRAPAMCKCMKGSSAYSVILELAPHLRRALDAMSSFPEHNASSSHISCSYLNMLQELSSSVTSVVEAVSSSLSSSTPIYNVETPNNVSLSTNASDQDSPLQRVLAARRASALKKAQVDQVSLDATSNFSQAHSTWENIDASGLGTEAPEFDQFMSWEPSPLVNWPAPFSLVSDL